LWGLKPEEGKIYQQRKGSVLGDRTMKIGGDISRGKEAEGKKKDIIFVIETKSTPSRESENRSK